MNREVVIVSAVRTPIGSYLGSLASVSATDLGAIAIKGALDKISISPKMIDEVLMGNVLQANLGQAPAKQAALKAGIPSNVPCTTVNKVCASGMKTITQAAQAIQCGDAEIIVAGGMENMSQVPHYFEGRKKNTFGNLQLTDGLLKDGLTNVYDQKHMGVYADLCANTHDISRKDQDAFTKESYTRAKDSWKNGFFSDEIVSVNVPQTKGEAILVTEDEEYKNIVFDKIDKLRPAFSEEGTVTAANASNLNDGAAALILMTSSKAEELKLTPLASIKSYADASTKPELFTTAPSEAIQKALDKVNLTLKDVDFFELNEAFAIVGIANCKLLNISIEKTNVHGGAVALGHPLGCSGARILVTLIHVLKAKNAQIGAAGICNGGGGATAIIIKKNNNG